ncbi:hypothetical protein IA800_04525 [Listeria seeligeri]|uniref:hypothetical protein n=1 Tax=Listeria seeligeri TaxID=1640 RepID=UPI001626A55F|nr:hypothetical protein [Listeria seeligeri]MBC1579145.1 hypothetical protein [Listeria seeligeri]MBC1596258.1 hypothetical protein [Listeria seeligeri]MBC1599360.1 hypothetical protein [Listeria seeligeri]MBC1731460.1 hypothetical protein [Listeria seeligeri]MBC1809153.1 hypothetical protein [Listeria seeligeri]
MTIKITRNARAIGGILPTKIKIENEGNVELKDGESYFFMPKNEKTKIKVDQWFSGSQEVELDNNNEALIKVNATAVVLQYSMFPFLFIGLLMTSVVSTGIALTLCLASLFYSRKNWFKIVKVEKQKR